MRRFVPALALVAAVAACTREEPAATPPPAAPSAALPVAPAVDAATLAALNRGVGLLGRFDFEDAEAALAPLAASDPVARLNLAIAIMNQTADGAQERAVTILDGLLADPAAAGLAARANYCKGLSLLYLGEPAEALAAFRAAEVPGVRDA